MVRLLVDRKEQREPKPVVSGTATRAEVAQSPFAQSRTWHFSGTFDAYSSGEAFNTFLAVSRRAKYVKCFYSIFFTARDSCTGSYKCDTRWQGEGGFFSGRCFDVNSASDVLLYSCYTLSHRNQPTPARELTQRPRENAIDVHSTALDMIS